MVIKGNTGLKVNLSEYRDGDALAGGMETDTSKLASYGDYLIKKKEELDTLFEKLNTAFSGVSGAWTASGSAELVTGFSSLITSAKEVGTELMSLGTFAKEKAAIYDEIQSTALKMMSSGG